MLDKNSIDLNRRGAPRMDVSPPWTARLDRWGNAISAELIDISEGGAKFRSSDSSIETGIRKGRLTGWTVNLPSGVQSRFRAEIRWFSRLPEGHIIGVHFYDTIDPFLLKEIAQLESPAPA